MVLPVCLVILLGIGVASLAIFALGGDWFLDVEED